MPTKISSLAAVDPRAEIEDDVQIGPFCLVGPHVKIGRGTKLDSHVTIVGHTTVGRDNRFFPNCVIGGDPQDYSYSGAPTRVEIGDGNLFREGVTVNRGAEKEDHVTRLGDRNMLMSNAHVAHNCIIGNDVVIVNGVLLGGHVHMHDGAIISGNSVVHHFGTLGTLSFVGGGSRVTTDVPPYMLSCGADTNRVLTVNLVGLQRRGIAPETIGMLKRAHRLLFRDCKGVIEARDILAGELNGNFPPELTNLLEFIENQKSGKQGRGGEARRGQKSVPAPVVEEVSKPLLRVA